MSLVTVEVSDLVATVTLARPPVNALSADMMRELATVFTDLGTRTDAAVAILTAPGEKIFCAGADVNESDRRYVRRELLASESVRDLVDPGDVVRRCLFAISGGDLPVVAAVNGGALGAGAALVASCDIVIASQNAYLKLPEIDVGVLGGGRHVQRLVGAAMAREMMYSARSVDAAEMYRLGAASRVVAPADLMSTAHEVAAAIAAKSPIALRLAKQVMSRVESLPLEQGYQLEQDYTARVSRFEDSREARMAWLEKRPPHWTWR